MPAFHKKITPADLDAIFQSDDPDLLENLAQAARVLTIEKFGRTVGLYAPLYISNYCDNYCVYCGFHAGRTITRRKLAPEEIELECQILASTGICNVLILTGESRAHSPVSYISEAIGVARRYFPNIALEIYPLETDEYAHLYRAGADGVTLYQETYNRERYAELHRAGQKRDYAYRYGAPERMARAGIRHISIGVLLGLADWREDVQALFAHMRYLENNFPGVEHSFSFPRLLKLDNDEGRYFCVKDRDMVKIICVARLLFPRVGINLSTRERAAFRDHAIEFGVTRMSAGSSTVVGGYGSPQKEGGEGQFTITDQRSLADIKAMLIRKGYDPVFTDWRNISNA